MHPGNVTFFSVCGVALSWIDMLDIDRAICFAL
jgi:hypothetical protein